MKKNNNDGSLPGKDTGKAPCITFLGAAREVTGSCHLLEANQLRIMLDCGMQQGGDHQKTYSGHDFIFLAGSHHD